MNITNTKFATRRLARTGLATAAIIVLGLSAAACQNSPAPASSTSTTVPTTVASATPTVPTDPAAPASVLYRGDDV